MRIVTVTGEKNSLSVHCKPINLTPENLQLAVATISMLMETIKPYMPAAGLAATQIGQSVPVFIFSWDRSYDNMVGAINPAFEPLSEEKIDSYEACFSTILGNGPYRIAKVPRYAKILARYISKDGQNVTQILENFSARVFQHECDHLDGIVNIFRKDAQVKSFETREEQLAFMNEVKKEDQVRYIPPVSFKE